MSKRKSKPMTLAQARDRGLDSDSFSGKVVKSNDNPQNVAGRLNYLINGKGWYIAANFGSPAKTLLFDPWGHKKYYSVDEAYEVEQARQTPTGEIITTNRNHWGVENTPFKAKRKIPNKVVAEATVSKTHEH